MSALALETQGLGLRFGAFQAVADVNLKLQWGARHALIGPNGAGKTTLINLLTGVYTPTSGSIRMNGQDITAHTADQRARLGLARTFQINQFFPSLTPRLSVVMAIHEREGQGAIWWRPYRRSSACFDEAHALLKRLRLDAVADVRVAELPYGQQRLLEIALALAARPRILLLDEPAAGVPKGESGDLFDTLAELPQDISVLFIEHDMNLVFRFAQRISVLVAGRILAEGSPGDIARDPCVREVYLGRTDLRGHVQGHMRGDMGDPVRGPAEPFHG